MLIRRKSSTDDEYHHEDVLGVFGVITGASGAVLSSNVYDSFMGVQYVQGVSKTTQRATCYKALSEPTILTGNGGRGVVIPSRGFQVMGKHPAPLSANGCSGGESGGRKSKPCTRTNPVDQLICCLSAGMGGSLVGCLEGVKENRICLVCLAGVIASCFIGGACMVDIWACALACGESAIDACITGGIFGAIVGIAGCMGLKAAE